MPKVSKVLLLLKNMIYESTSPMEIVRFARYYKRKGLEVIVVLWGPMGILLGKRGKNGRMRYEEEVQNCLDMGIKFLACDLAAQITGIKQEEMMDGVKIVESFQVAELMLQYQEEGQLIISL